MKLFVKKNPKLVLPKQANPSDAGYDIVATTEPVIVGEFIARPLDQMKMWKTIQYIEYGTGLFVAPQTAKKVSNFTADASGALCGTLTEPVDYHTFIFPRSSISKYNLALANSIGVIDNGYRAEIKVRFKYVFQPEDLVMLQEAGGMRVYGIINTDKIYQQGDRIAQIIASENLGIEFEEVVSLDETSRNLGGFGSSGVK